MQFTNYVNLKNLVHHRPELGLALVKMNTPAQKTIKQAVNEVRKSWVDYPQPSLFANHRNLISCEHDLKVMVLGLRKYAYNDEENDIVLLQAVHDYVLNAHTFTSKLLTSGSMERMKNGEKGHLDPASPRVQKLLSEYDSNISDKLKRYFDKTKRPLGTKSEESTETSSAQSAIDSGGPVAFTKELVTSYFAKKVN